MDTVLGLIGLVIFVAATIGLAAGVTYLIVKISPSGKAAKERAAKPKASGSG